MAAIDQKSCLCVKSELDLFSVPPTQTSIEHGTVVKILPSAAITDDGPIEFDVEGSTEDYLDMTNTLLHVQAKIINGDGTVIANDAHVGPVNLFLHSMFSQVDVSLGEKEISSSNNTYAYRAYLETLLDYGKPAKESQLTSSLWYKDTAGHMDVTHVRADLATNLGLVKRTSFTNRSHIVDMLGRIHGDVFFQERLLLSNLNVHIRLTRSDNRFAIMGDGADLNYKVVITKAELLVRKVRVAPAIALAHAKALELSNAKYPIMRVECKTFTVPAGSLNCNQGKVFTGQRPTRVIIGCVDNDAFNGRYNKNPFNFKNYSITRAALKVDEHEQPAKPIKCNFTTRHVAEAYMSLFTETGKAFKDEDIDVSMEDYVVGYALFCYDLTPDMGDSDHYSLIKTSTVSVEIDFAEALRETINVIVYAEFQNVLEVDRNRNVFFDFKA